MVNPPYDERMSALGVAGAGKGVGRERAQMNSAAAWEHRSPRRDPSGAPVGAHDGDRDGDFVGDFVGAPASDTAPASTDFFSLLASHWKKNFSGWQAWVLTPNLKLPGQMRLKESRRVPLWNGPIECRMFKFDMVKGSNTGAKKAGPEA
jgi:putative N6-adenine-specific DNA methylase